VRAPSSRPSRSPRTRGTRTASREAGAQPTVLVEEVRLDHERPMEMRKSESDPSRICPRSDSDRRSVLGSESDDVQGRLVLEPRQATEAASPPLIEDPPSRMVRLERRAAQRPYATLRHQLNRSCRWPHADADQCATLHGGCASVGGRAGGGTDPGTSSDRLPSVPDGSRRGPWTSRARAVEGP
jgi:hypothetical protein